MAIFRLVCSLLVLVFGIATTLSLSYRWILIGAVLYSMPFLLQLSRSSTLRLCSITVGIVLVGQSLLSPVMRERRPKTLRPSMSMTWDIRDGIHGIDGLQHVTTDAKGFRVTKMINYEDSSSYRIFALGASTTEQLLIDDERTWTHQLQESLEGHVPNVEVVNCGLSGTRSEQNFLTLQNIAQYHPDMAILDIGMNDAYYQIVTHFDPFYPFSFDRTFLGKTVRDYWERIIPLLRGSRENGGIQVISGKDYEKKRNSLARNSRREFRPERVSDDYAYYVEEIIRSCNSGGFRCVFLTQPTGYRVGASKEFKKGFWMTPPETRYTLDFGSMVYIARLYNDYISQMARTHEMHLIDIEGEIPPSYEYMYDDAHLNIKGVKAIAEILTRDLLPVILADMKRDGLPEGRGVK